MPIRRCLLLLCLAVPAGGCTTGDWAYDLLYPSPPKIEIGDRPVAVLAFASAEAMARHPDVEREVAAAVIAQLRYRLPKTKFISTRVVHTWKVNHPEWRRMGTGAIGKALKAGLIIEINVTDFRVRPAGASRMVLQGAIAAQARVTDVASGRMHWRRGKVEVRHPVQPTSVYDSSESEVRVKAIQRFAAQFAFAFLEVFEG